MSIKETSDSCGYQQITSLSASTGLTIPTLPDGSKPTACVLRCETQNVRWRDDNTAPTATVGMLMITTDEPYFYDGPLDKIRFIEVTASAKLNISYYR